MRPEYRGPGQRWFERFVRSGYLVKGVVYVLIGSLALQLAIGTGGRTTTASGALLTIVRQPFGRGLLLGTAVGLLGYALWRLAQGLFDVEGKGTEAKGLLKRAGYVVSGLAYGSLSYEAARIVVGVGSPGSGQSTELWISRILVAPMGGWIVAAGAVVMFVLAGNATLVAVRGMYRKKLMLHDMGPRERRLADVAAVTGLVGRGAVFALVGVLLVRAAIFRDASEAGSSEEALDMLIRWPAGPWLLGVVAVGLVAYGGYAWVQARWRSIDVNGGRGENR